MSWRHLSILISILKPSSPYLHGVTKLVSGICRSCGNYCDNVGSGELSVKFYYSHYIVIYGIEHKSYIGFSSVI